ncbi:dephospho-CoA kinase [Burkholderia sp. L27(2015)]|uniref:dephospho-CoA kinase n=1 Tax=Burkholderia sp. L27(2015) TaxID=1641858 RepID=UPI00131C43FF|nr:dephospho-CoA kinase [Burkholderia sp. L27(2015)]
MFSVGLTGGIGSGKSVVAERFALHGATVVDSDLIAHQITAPGGAAMPLIEARFGSQFLTSTGALDRARMRALVFGDAAAKLKLEAITHPLIRAECDRAAQAALGPYVIYVVPLLVESGNWKDRVNRVLVVDCSESTQIRRVIERNGFTREQVAAIMAQQATRAARLAYADDVIDNDQVPLEHVLKKVDKLHLDYLNRAKCDPKSDAKAKTITETPRSS